MCHMYYVVHVVGSSSKTGTPSTGTNSSTSNRTWLLPRKTPSAACRRLRRTSRMPARIAVEGLHESIQYAKEIVCPRHTCATCTDVRGPRCDGQRHKQGGAKYEGMCKGSEKSIKSHDRNDWVRSICEGGGEGPSEITNFAACCVVVDNVKCVDVG